MKIPMHIPKEVVLAMARVALLEDPISKAKILFVDEELYGRVEFPYRFAIGRGQKLRFPGYGEVQVLEVTVDTLRCTKTIDEGLYREWQEHPPAPDPVPRRWADFSKCAFRPDTSQPGWVPAFDPAPACGVPGLHRPGEPGPGGTGAEAPRPGSGDPRGKTPARFL